MADQTSSALMTTKIEMADQSPKAMTEAGGSQSQPVIALYVGDLDPSVTEAELSMIFSQMGDVISVRLCMDHTKERSLCYGYVNYSNPQDAAKALKELNFTRIKGKPIRVSYANRDSSSRKNTAGNVFVKNLNKGVDSQKLHAIFSSFGNIVSSKVATDANGESKGHGFVQYDSEEAAKKAIEQMSGKSVYGKEIYVGPFLSRQEREEKTKFTNVFVKNLSASTSEEDLKEIFGKFGVITSVAVIKDEAGNSNCFGFVNFENPEDAAKSVESLNGKVFDDKEWYVGRAKTKSEREKEILERSQGRNNLYVKNLDDSIDDDKLKELFSPFGVITSCEVSRDSKGISRGYGFVAFSTNEEASKAMSETNKKIIGSKPLYVAVAERKEDRAARLQAYFSHLRPNYSVMTPLPVYTPGSAGVGQQIFYGQAPPPLLSPMDQFFPGARPAVPFMPNTVLPLIRPAQQGPFPGGRHAGVDSVQEQGFSRGRGNQYPNVSAQGFSGSVHREIGSSSARDTQISQRSTVQTLASALANAPPEKRRMMLGERLYPLVEQLEPESAAKVTRMLLQMDQSEVLHLIESPQALRAKVAEAIQVLLNARLQEDTSLDEKFMSLTLDD